MVLHLQLWKFVLLILNCIEDFDQMIDIFRLQEELYQQKERWDKQIVDVSRSQVSKDVELQRLKENEEKLKSELLQRKQDIERYVVCKQEA